MVLAAFYYYGDQANFAIQKVTSSSGKFQAQVKVRTRTGKFSVAVCSPVMDTAALAAAAATTLLDARSACSGAELEPRANRGLSADLLAAEWEPNLQDTWSRRDP